MTCFEKNSCCRSNSLGKRSLKELNQSLLMGSLLLEKCFLSFVSKLSFKILFIILVLIQMR
jgi:hypothetical protein